MPLKIRAYQSADAAPLRHRFAGETRPPWLRLPPPFALDALLAADDGLTRFVVESGRGDVVGLVALDTRGDFPLILGPLVSDEQLAELLSNALLNQALTAAAEQGLEAVLLKADVREERAVSFLINQGFRVLDWREYYFEARPPEEIEGEDDPAFGPCPEMVSSDYGKLYQALGPTLGRPDRADWERSQIFDHLQRTDLFCYAARHAGRYVGVIELTRTGPAEAEVSYGGVLPDHAELWGPFVAQMLRHAWQQWHLERVRLSVLAREVPPELQSLGTSGFQRRRALLLLEKPLEQTHLAAR